MSDQYLDKRKAAEYLDISVRTLEGHSSLPRFRLGGKVLYRRSEIDDWMAQHRDQSYDDICSVVDGVLADVLPDQDTHQ
jgi:predicted DNA-binding transcriptional regulator AlpA